MTAAHEAHHPHAVAEVDTVCHHQWATMATGVHLVTHLQAATVATVHHLQAATVHHHHDAATAHHQVTMVTAEAMAAVEEEEEVMATEVHHHLEAAEADTAVQKAMTGEEEQVHRVAAVQAVVEMQAHHLALVDTETVQVHHLVEGKA